MELFQPETPVKEFVRLERLVADNNIYLSYNHL